MKQIAVILLIVLFIPTLLALNLETKTQYNSGETLTAKISGDFAEKISSDDISFYRKHIEIPMEFELEKIENNYYLYAILPQPEELTNYSVVVKAKIMNNTKVNDIELKNDFVISPEKALFNVKPGFLKTETDFSLTLQNLVEENIIVNVKTGEEKKGFFSSLFGSSNKEESVTLKSKEIQKIYFQKDDFKETPSTITLTSNDTEYSILIFIPTLPEKDKPEVNPEDDITIPPEIKKEAKEKNVEPKAIQKCAEMGGAVCAKTEKCEGEEKTAYDAMCCIGGTCTKKTVSSLNKILGIGIIAIIILVIFILLAKYKGTRKSFNLLDVARGK